MGVLLPVLWGECWSVLLWCLEALAIAALEWNWDGWGFLGRLGPRGLRLDWSQ